MPSEACDDYTPGTFGRCKNCSKQKKAHQAKIPVEASPTAVPEEVTVPPSPTPEGEGVGAKLWRRLSRGSFTAGELPVHIPQQQENFTTVESPNNDAGSDADATADDGTYWKSWTPKQVYVKGRCFCVVT